MTDDTAPTTTAAAVLAPPRARGRAAPPPAPAVPALVFAIPGPDEPGFIRRQRAAQAHIAALKGGGVAAMDDLVEFLLGFIAEPADRDAAREQLYDLSRTRYQQLLQAVLQESDAFLQ